MIRLVCLYGVGDTYLVCALARAFERHHGLQAEIVVKLSHSAIPEMFGLRYVADDIIVAKGEGDHFLQASHENRIVDGSTFFVHPHFVRSGARLDQLTVKARASQADMYRALMRLPPWEPLEWPTFEAERVADTVLLTRSNSWPGLPSEFWISLRAKLNGSVLVNNDSNSLGDLFRFAAGAGWIIGPQCGAMAALIEMGIRARKTLVIRELGLDCPYLFGLTKTMPYGHASTFAGNEHPEVEHVIVSPERWQDAIEKIV